MERLVCLFIGYLIGNIFQTAYWFGRFHHIDIRNYGSGNAGTTNVMRTLGKKAGIITYFVDALKVVLAAVIIHFLYGNTFGNEMLLILYSGLGVILGHNYPFYLNFKGGKGIAATSGLVFSLVLFPKYCWILVVLGFLTFSLGTYFSKYVSFGSLLFIALFFIEYIIFGLVGLLPLTGATLYESFVIVFAISALGFWRHRQNIGRLMHGTERKIGQKKTEEQNG